MTSPMFDELEQAAEQLREQGERIRGFHAELAGRSTSVVSKDRMVTATVGGTGRLTGLTIKGNRYRVMPPAELANVLMETVNAALEQASAQTLAAARSLMPDSFGADGVGLDGSVDLEEYMKAALEKIDSSGVRWYEDPAGGGA